MILGGIWKKGFTHLNYFCGTSITEKEFKEVFEVAKKVLDLGAEFFRWEIATAVAGSLFRIDPFDQPDVQAAKDNTDRLLRKFESEGKLTEPEPLLREAGTGLYGGPRAKALLKRLPVHP